MKHSNSSTKSFRRCPRQWAYKYVEDLEKKTVGVPSTRGVWLHEMIEEHYGGGDWREVFESLASGFGLLTFEASDMDEAEAMPDLVENIMLSYLSHWKRDDAKLKFIELEMDEEVELPNGDTFHFIIDALVEDASGGLWIWDHKSVKSLMTDSFMMMDAQTARYFWAATQLGIKKLKGAVFNEICTKDRTMPKWLEDSERYEKRTNIGCDVYTYARFLKRNGQDLKDYAKVISALKAKTPQWFRRTHLVRDKKMVDRTMNDLMWTVEDIMAATERGDFPRAVDKSCAWGCDFHNICSVELLGGDATQTKKVQYRKREKGGRRARNKK